MKGGILMNWKRYKNEGQFLKIQKSITKQQIEELKCRKKLIRNLRPGPNRSKN